MVEIENEIENYNIAAFSERVGWDYRKRTHYYLRVKRIPKIFQDLKRSRGGARVLDIGCGDGELSYQIKNLGFDVFGVDLFDPSSESFKAAQKRGIKIKSGNVSEGLPFEDSFFDIVLAAQVLEHVFDVEKALTEISRVLTKGGVLVVTVPNLANLVDRLALLMGKLPREARFVDKDHLGHIRFFTAESLKQALTKTGFKSISLEANCVRIGTRRRKFFDSEFLAKIFPTLGENLISTAVKEKP